MEKINAGIIGGAGYTGGELMRILLNHPGVNISFIHSRSNAGRSVATIHQDLIGDTPLNFTDDLSGLNDGSIDVVFLCLGHGESKKFLSENAVNGITKIIDLANDFRLAGSSSIGDRSFVYGLPELNKEQIKTAQNVANPGCFATAIQLGLLPLAKAGLLTDTYTTGITGSTGAGQSLSGTSHFSWRANNIQAYKTLTHQHLGEVGESLLQLQPVNDVDINFVPWRGDFTRGIFISSTLTCDTPIKELEQLYKEFYEGQPFIRLSTDAIFLTQTQRSKTI